MNLRSRVQLSAVQIQLLQRLLVMLGTEFPLLEQREFGFVAAGISSLGWTSAKDSNQKIHWGIIQFLRRDQITVRKYLNREYLWAIRQVANIPPGTTRYSRTPYRRR